MQKTISVSWGKFALVIAPMVFFAWLLVTAGESREDSWVVSWAISVIVASLVGFLAVGWARLRSVNARTPIDRQDLLSIGKALVGPVWIAVAWFVLTFLTSIASLVVWAIQLRAA